MFIMALLWKVVKFLILLFRKLQSYKVPLYKSVMESLSHKKFSDETIKKVKWVKGMYVDWRNFRNSQDDLQSFQYDIEDIETVTKENLTDALCRFLTEEKKLDGSDFLARTMYDIVICL